jgi:FtsH-binding integral membrane protein
MTMSFQENPYRSPVDVFAAQAATDERAAFILKTYLHLTGAILLFAVLTGLILQTPGVEKLVFAMVGNQVSWLVVLVCFIGAGYVAGRWANSATGPAMQYLGLGLYVVVEALIFTPILYIASHFGGPNIIPSAGLATLALFGAMTAVVFVTRHDFSFLRSVLLFGAFAALGLIVLAIVFGFALGPIFTYAMIALACGYILYDTSNILHHYRIGQHVGASLALFASVMLLFWYILRLFLSRRN